MNAIGAILGAAVVFTAAGVAYEVSTQKPIPPKILLYDSFSTCGPEGSQLKTELNRADTESQLVVMHQLSAKADSLWGIHLQVLAIQTNGSESTVYVGVGGQPGVGVVNPSFSPKPTDNGGLIPPEWINWQSINGVEFAFTVTPEQAANLKVGGRASAVWDFTTDPEASAADKQAAADNLAAYQQLIGQATQGCTGIPVFRDTTYVSGS